MVQRLVVLAGWLIDGSGAPASSRVLLHIENGRIVALEQVPMTWMPHAAENYPGHAGAGVPGRANPGKPDSNRLRDRPADRSGTFFAAPPDLPTPAARPDQGPAPGQAAPAPPFLDLSHCTILPGLVDSHVHLFMSGTSDPEIRKAQREASLAASRQVISGHLRRHRSCGVLAVRDGGDRAGHTLRVKLESLTAPQPPLLRSPGTAWHAHGRYGALIGRAPPREAALADSIALFLREWSDRPPANAPARNAATVNPGARHPSEGPQRSSHPVDHLKIVNSGLNSLARFGVETPPQFPLDQLKAAVEVGRRQGLKTMVHANGELPVRIAIEAGCGSVEHGFFMGRDNLARLAERQIFWVPTAVTMQAYTREPGANRRDPDVARRNLDHQLEQLRLARELGVPVAAGTDSGSLGVHHGESLREEVGLLMLAGFPLEAAVRCASWNGARLLGVEEDLGLLGPGRPATFVAVEADPSALPAALARVAAVFVRGQSFAIPSVPCMLGTPPNRGAP